MGSSKTALHPNLTKRETPKDFASGQQVFKTLMRRAKRLLILYSSFSPQPPLKSPPTSPTRTNQLTICLGDLPIPPPCPSSTPCPFPRGGTPKTGCCPIFNRCHSLAGITIRCPFCVIITIGIPGCCGCCWTGNPCPPPAPAPGGWDSECRNSSPPLPAMPPDCCCCTPGLSIPDIWFWRCIVSGTRLGKETRKGTVVTKGI
jgi:hypothetical protein